jgi:hypothetical protein
MLFMDFIAEIRWRHFISGDDISSIGMPIVLVQRNLDLAPLPTMELCGISQKLTNRKIQVI